MRAAALYRFPTIRRAVARLRFANLVTLRGVRAIDEHGSSSHTVLHNKKSLEKFDARNERLLFGIKLLEDVESSRVLLIGCRNEEEILMFRGYGFNDIKALDLISYSPWIDLGDMHRMPYSDSSFDVVFSSYTLSYSDDPRRAAYEMVRVTADGGYIALAVEYMPHQLRAEIQQSLLGYQIGTRVPLDSTTAIRELFEPHVAKVVVDYDAQKKRHHRKDGLIPNPSPIILIFQVRK